MIFTERTITVVNDSATINKPLILYRGDKNIELKITIAESQFKFRYNDASNVIETTDASYAQLVINTPYGSPIFSDVAATKNGAVIFVISAAMIDEIREVGAYEIQIRLLDDNKQSRASIPPVSNAIEIREPIAIEDGSAVDSNIVNVAKVNRALTTTNTPLEAFDSQGNYIKKTWGDGDPITDAALNKIEVGIDGVNKKIGNVNSQIKNIANNFSTEQDGNSYIIKYNGIIIAKIPLNVKSQIEVIVDKIKTANSLAPINIKLIGDSITHGMGGTGYAQDGDTIWGSFKVNISGYCWANVFKKYLEANYNCTVTNYGTSGVKTAEVLANIDTLVTSEDDIVICMIGTNNKLDSSLDTFKTQLQSIIETIKNKGKDIIVMCSIPTTVANDNTTTFTMGDINTATSEVISNLGMEYISLYNLWNSYCSANNIAEANVYADNVHPNDAGYLIMINLILNQLGFNTSIDFSYNSYWVTTDPEPTDPEPTDPTRLKIENLTYQNCTPVINNNQLCITNATKDFPLILLEPSVDTVEFDVDVSSGMYTWVVLGGDYESALIMAIYSDAGGNIMLLPNEGLGGTLLQEYDYRNKISHVKLEKTEDRIILTYNNSDTKEYLFSSNLFNGIEIKRFGFMVQADSPSKKGYKNIKINV